MPFNPTDAYLTDGRWRCASCFFYLAVEADPVTVPSEPPPGRACDECGIHLIIGDPNCESQTAIEERAEQRHPGGGFCPWCTPRTIPDVLPCYSCEAVACAEHAAVCGDCGQRTCPAHDRRCACRTGARCTTCHVRHAAQCGRRPARAPQYPAFDFLCDSSEDLVKEKHKRPRLLDKHGNPRRQAALPTPGVFAAEPDTTEP